MMVSDGRAVWLTGSALLMIISRLDLSLCACLSAFPMRNQEMKVCQDSCNSQYPRTVHPSHCPTIKAAAAGSWQNMRQTRSPRENQGTRCSGQRLIWIGWCYDQMRHFHSPPPLSTCLRFVLIILLWMSVISSWFPSISHHFRRLLMLPLFAALLSSTIF